LNGGDSPLTEVSAFLDAASIPTSMREPFLAPVDQTYRFGMADIEKAVKEGYEDDVRPEIDPLLGRFPFNTASSTDASAADVEASLGKKGSYWKAFDAIVVPVCDKSTDGVYTAKSAQGRTVQLPAGATKLAQWATKLGKVLWDKDGKAQPLYISAKPLPLPSMEPEETVTLSYLRSGSASVYGFNQTPAYQTLAAPWSPGEPSSVGLELTTTGGGEKQFASIDVENSDFAILRLLEKAKTTQTVVYTWELTPGGSASKPYAISFSLASNPFAPFRPPSEVGVR
jgi:type VI protein secretion system component VasK